MTYREAESTSQPDSRSSHSVALHTRTQHMKDMNVHVCSPCK